MGEGGWENEKKASKKAREGGKRERGRRKEAERRRKGERDYSRTRQINSTPPFVGGGGGELSIL